jgi:HPt (histidine-containing phosphotransfer) domain-containing protein
VNATPDVAFFARLRAQDAAFSAGLPAMLEYLAALYDPRVAAPAPAVSTDMQRRLHTLSGCAATFGYRRLGIEARALEQRLRVLQAFEAVPAVDWTEWYRQLVTMIVWARADPRDEHGNSASI